MRLRFVGLAIVAGCGFQIATSGSGTGDGPPAAGSDASTDDGAPPIDAAPDAPPIDARICPAAPANCVGFTCGNSNHCYWVCSSKESWNAAKDHCANVAGACIATIDDAAEDACIAAHVAPAFPDIVWFGFKQTGNNEPAGGWGWQCGNSAYRAGNWGDFEPNDDNDNEDCGAMITGGAWIDGNCGTQARYVCELP